MSDIGTVYDQQIKQAQQAAPPVPSYRDSINQQTFGNFLFALTDPKKAMLYAGGSAVLLGIIMTIYLKPVQDTAYYEEVKTQQQNRRSNSNQPSPSSPSRNAQPSTQNNNTATKRTSFSPTHFAVINDRDGFTNVRRGPNTSYQRIGKIRTGEEFQVVKGNGTWWQVRLPNGKIGYMAKSRIKLLRGINEQATPKAEEVPAQKESPAEAPPSNVYFKKMTGKGWINGDRVNLRKDPAIHMGNILTQLDKGTEVQLLQVFDAPSMMSYLVNTDTEVRLDNNRKAKLYKGKAVTFLSKSKRYRNYTHVSIDLGGNTPQKGHIKTDHISPAQGKWYQLSSAKGTGWIHAKFVSMEGAENISSPTVPTEESERESEAAKIAQLDKEARALFVGKWRNESGPLEYRDNDIMEIKGVRYKWVVKNQQLIVTRRQERFVYDILSISQNRYKIRNIKGKRETWNGRRI